MLLWTPSHRREKAERPARNYIQQLCADTGCSLEELPEEIDDRDGWWERVRKIRGSVRHDDDDDDELICLKTKPNKTNSA